MMDTTVAQKAAALERANEIATSALDPWGAIEGLKLEAETKDAEIGQLKAAAQRDADWIVMAQDALRSFVGYGGLPSGLISNAESLLSFNW